LILIEDILAEFSESYSKEEYSTLLIDLEGLTAKLKETNRPRPRKKRKEKPFSHGPTTNLGGPNVTTRPRNAQSKDQVSADLEKSRQARRESASDEEPAATSLPSKPEASKGTTDKSTPEENAPHEESSAIEDSGKVEASSQTTAGKHDSAGYSEAQMQHELQLEIKRCKEGYRGKDFIVSCDGYLLEVKPDEVDEYFSRFGPGWWLSDRHIMPILASLDWPSTTLVLDSHFTSGSVVGNARWPVNNSHERVILPYNSESHWTLVDINLRDCVLRQYNSLEEDGGRLARVTAIAKEKLAHARGEQDANLTAFCGVFTSH